MLLAVLLGTAMVKVTSVTVAPQAWTLCWIMFDAMAMRATSLNAQLKDWVNTIVCIHKISASNAVSQMSREQC